MAYKDKEKQKEYMEKYRIGIGETSKEKLTEKAIYDKKYREDNKEKLLERKTKYREDNKEKIIKQSKKYYKDNKEKIIVSAGKYAKNNKEKVKEYKSKYYIDNRDPNTPLKGSDEHRIKISCAHQGIDVKDFNGYATDSPYCEKFNESCRERNREKYGRVCFICGKIKEQNSNRSLSVHHISKNKMEGCDGSKWQLIPLCMSCHGKAHHEPLQSRIMYLLNHVWRTDP